MKPSLLWAPLAWIICLIIRARNLCYRTGLFKIRRAPVPVISVGNITVGGTGKSPITMWLAEWLRDSGKKPAILSRGYGRKTRGYRLVHDGNRLLENAQTGGDEPVMMAMRLLNVPVAVCENRVLGAQRLVEDTAVNVLILDDGFQHRQIHRDLDIVLIDAERNPYNDHCLPAGWLREPPGELKRANLLLLTKGSREQKSGLQKLLQQLHLPVGEMFVKHLELVDYTTQNPVDTDKLDNLNFLLVTAVAKPSSVKHSCTQLGIQPRQAENYSDHHVFSEADVAHWIRISRAQQLTAIVTTEKDAVKLASFRSQLKQSNLNVYILKQYWQPDETCAAYLQNQLTRLLGSFDG